MGEETYAGDHHGCAMGPKRLKCRGMKGESTGSKVGGVGRVGAAGGLVWGWHGEGCESGVGSPPTPPPCRAKIGWERLGSEKCKDLGRNEGFQESGQKEGGRGGEEASKVQEAYQRAHGSLKSWAQADEFCLHLSIAAVCAVTY